MRGRSCREAASHFAGTHDFTQFSSVPSVTRPINPVKTVTSVDVAEVEGGIRIALDGSGFLYNQCRHMVGCLISVGLGALRPDDVIRLLEIGAREYPGASLFPLTNVQIREENRPRNRA